jgi:hypothetical protein
MIDNTFQSDFAGDPDFPFSTDLLFFGSGERLDPFFRSSGERERDLLLD